MAGTGRIANLRPPWKPGESGDPAGRPKKRPISDRYNFLVEMRLPKKLRLELGLWKGATYADALAMRQIDAAIAGNCQAAREVREAIEGKSNQRLETVDAEPFTVLVRYENAPQSNKLPNDASSDPKASQDDEKGSE
jgi:hypothetical protein